MGSDHLLSRAQLLQQIFVLGMSKPDQPYINDRRLLFVEYRCTRTEIVKRFAATRDFGGDILDLVILP